MAPVQPINPFPVIERAECFIKGFEGDESQEGIGQLLADLRAARAAVEHLVAEIYGIATADPSKWDEEVRDQFRQWAQSRARHVLVRVGLIT